MKNRTVLAMGSCVLLTFVLFAITSCGSPGSKESGVPEKAQAAADSAVATTPKAIEAEARLNGDGGWMEGIPATVPPFAYGTFDSKESSAFTGASGNSTMYSLYYDGVTLEQAADYAAKLKAAGFQISEENAHQGDMSVSGFLPQGEGRLGFSISFQSSGHVDLHINVIKKYE
ncbi:MAG: hypothetical protein ACYDH0_02905 [Candidatus Aminicenantales bacterium]